MMLKRAAVGFQRRRPARDAAHAKHQLRRAGGVGGDAPRQGGRCESQRRIRLAAQRLPRHASVAEATSFRKPASSGEGSASQRLGSLYDRGQQCRGVVPRRECESASRARSVPATQRSAGDADRSATAPARTVGPAVWSTCSTVAPGVVPSRCAVRSSKRIGVRAAVMARLDNLGGSNRHRYRRAIVARSPARRGTIRPARVSARRIRPDVQMPADLRVGLRAVDERHQPRRVRAGAPRAMTGSQFDVGVLPPAGHTDRGEQAQRRRSRGHSNQVSAQGGFGAWAKRASAVFGQRVAERQARHGECGPRLARQACCEGRCRRRRCASRVSTGISGARTTAKSSGS